MRIALRNKPLAIFPIADVTGERENATAGARGDIAGRLLTGVELAAGDDEVGAMLGKGFRNREAETTATAGDDRGLAAEVEGLHAFRVASGWPQESPYASSSSGRREIGPWPRPIGKPRGIAAAVAHGSGIERIARTSGSRWQSRVVRTHPRPSSRLASKRFCTAG